MVTLPRQCVLWGCLLTAVHLGQCITCDDKQYLFNGRCCDLCQPGRRLESHCTDAIKTQCLLCDSGEFMNKWNKELRCYQHTHCESKEGLEVEKQGTADTDTICACKEGQHCTSEECQRCAQHTSCGPGFGVKQMATRTADTVCEPCPAGFFSSGSSAFEQCHPWTSCEAKNMVVQQEGTNRTDAVCGVQSRTRALLVIPIVMAVLITIFIAVSFCIKKVVKEPEDNKASLPAVETGDPTETEDCLGHNTAPVQETLVGSQPVAQEDGKESRIAVQERQLMDSMDLKHLV
ncbi:tumor necrosis factor receptor superfamily member 5 isoform X1 [Cricetulus griseus]|uniref:Tumor necrosis factor receptor superfamily member 5 n=2 Tax=Cricetulus griseus TaxID=10029 RepID=A0A8C2MLT4_CRIGR|nr:tumor necrosis factor receptor superfamily member 5 isoform X1 [Cricetulus griseus]XP_027279220.1 tumor necrosis factor receptor superfamily member 5 isoform X1 [Cricetulus griseus]